MRQRNITASLFMNNPQVFECPIGQSRAVGVRAPSANLSMSWKRRQTPVSGGSSRQRAACCPQILWIKVCVSC